MPVLGSFHVEKSPFCIFERFFCIVSCMSLGLSLYFMKSFLCGRCRCFAFVQKYLGNLKHVTSSTELLGQEAIFWSICEYMHIADDVCE